MLSALSVIASDQASPMEATMRKTKLFLDYTASRPDTIIIYRASNMILALHSDALYLSEPKDRSRAGGHQYCPDHQSSGVISSRIRVGGNVH